MIDLIAKINGVDPGSWTSEPVTSDSEVYTAKAFSVIGSQRSTAAVRLSKSGCIVTTYLQSGHHPVQTAPAALCTETLAKNRGRNVINVIAKINGLDPSSLKPYYVPFTTSGAKYVVTFVDATERRYYMTMLSKAACRVLEYSQGDIEE